MADPSVSHPIGAPVDPDEVVRRTFSVGFRGFDQQEVRAFLAHVAGELRAARAVEGELRRRIEDLEHHSGDREEGIDEERLTAALGHEAGRLLQAARDTAAEVRERAEADAAELRGAAERVLAERSAEAEEAAAAIRATAASDAEGVVEEARERGREMLAEAQAVRERILRDLARRRRHAHQQLEQLRAARERLLDSYRVVQQTVDEATRELSIAESEAKAAAEAAGLRVATEPEASVAELEAEVAAARDADLPIVDAELEEAVEAAATGAPVVEAPEATTPTELPPVPDGKPSDGPDDDDRRGKRRRLRRAGRGDEETLTKATLSRLDTGDELEAVRIIRPTTDVASSPAATEPTPPPEPTPPTGDAVAADGPPPEAPARDPEPTPAAEAPEPSEVAEAVSAARATEAATAEAGEPEQPAESPRTVEALFAKIRADRAATSDDDAGRPHADAAGEADASGTEEEDDAAAADVSPVEAGDAADVSAAAPEEAEAQPAEPSPFAHRDESTGPVATALTRALKRALTDEQNEVLDALRRSRGKPSVADILPAEEDHRARYRYVAQPLLADAATGGAASVGGGPADAAAAVDELARRVSEALRQRLEAALEEAGDDDEAAGRVSAAYREWKSQRAEPVAAQLALAAFSLGVYQATGDDAPLRWVVDPDGRCGPDCDDNSLAGAVRRGQPFPTGHLHPPAHDGCRCLLVRATF